jgi:hypothetical protein
MPLELSNVRKLSQQINAMSVDMRQLGWYIAVGKQFVKFKLQFFLCRPLRAQ